MGSTFNPIVIAISDGVDPSIPSKITAIGTAARETDLAVKSLKATLASINANGISSLKASVDAVSSANTRLSQETKQVVTSNRDLITSTQQVAAAHQVTAQSVLQGELISQRLRDSRKGLAQANKELVSVESQLGASAALGNVQSKAAIASEKERVAAALQNVVASKAASLAYNQQAMAAMHMGNSMHASVTGIQATSGAIRVLEGNFGTNVRAAENFIVKVLNLGNIMKAVFPVIGAMALVGVFDILAEHIGKVLEALKQFNVEYQKTITDAIIAGDKIIKAKREPFLSASNLGRLLTGAERPEETLDVKNMAAALKQLQLQENLAKAVAAANQEGMKGSQLEKQKITDIQQEIDLARQRLAVAKSMRDVYISQLDAQKTVTHQAWVDTRGVYHPEYTSQVPTITDPNQRKAIQEQLQTAIGAAGSRDFDSKGIYGELENEVDILKQKLRGAQLALPFKEVGDQTKAARDQLKLFKEEMAQLKLDPSTGVVSPQERLKLLDSQRARAMAANIPQVDSERGVATQEIKRQDEALKMLRERYSDMASNVGLYSDKLREASMWQKVKLQLDRDHIPVTDALKKEIQDAISYTVENTRYDRELASVYEQFNGPLRSYQAALTAINKLLDDGTISEQQATIARIQAINALKTASDPMLEYNRSLDRESALLKFYGQELAVQTEISRVRQSLPKGKDLDQQQILQLRQRLTEMNQQKLVQSELNSIWTRTEGEQLKLDASQKALNKAYADGIVTLTDYKMATLAVQLAENKLKNDRGLGDFRSHFVQVLGELVDASHSATSKMTAIWGNYFKTLKDGFADSIGRALVYNESLKQGLLDTARQAVAELISAVIKLGIEMLIVSALTKVFPQLKTLLDKTKTEDTTKQTLKNTGVAIASIGAIAAAEYAAIQILLEPAWSLAEAISLMSFGANAIGAIAGIEAVQAAGGKGIQNTLGLNAGGLVPGIGSTDTVNAKLTPGEFVLRQAAVQQIGVPTLQAMNRGANYIQTESGSGAGSKVEINVEHDGSTAVAVEQISENKIRIIARQEAKNTVEQHAPAVIAGEMDNPNSKPSKSMSRNYSAPRKR